MAIFLVICQQALLIGLGILVYANGIAWLAIGIWLLCLPMLYINKQTYAYVLKNGFFNFMALNADTSELDVPKEKRFINDDIQS